MITLRTSPLADRVSQFRSVKETVGAAITARSNIICQMHGYPVPSHVIAEIRRRCNFTSVDGLLQWMLDMRDIAKYASESLFALQHLRTEKNLLDTAPLIAYLNTNKQTSGYGHLTSSDIELCVQLMISGEASHTGWLLELNPNGSFLDAIHRLYRSLITSPSVSLDYDDKESSLSITTLPLVYDPLSDDLVPLDLMLLPDVTRREIAEVYKSKRQEDEAEGKGKKSSGTRTDFATKYFKEQQQKWSEVLTNEAELQRLANIRIVDHMFTLFMDTEIFDSFIVPRTTDGAPLNVERSKSLRKFAGYLQLMLNYAHIFRFEAFKESYVRFEAWHGSFPSIPAHLVANYEKYIRKYDVFGAQQDVIDLFNLYGGKDNNLGTTVHCFFEELVHHFGFSAQLKSWKSVPPPAAGLLKNLDAFANPALSNVLYSFPAGQFSLVDIISQRILADNVYERVTQNAINSLQGAFGSLLSDEVLAEITNMGLKPFAGWHAHLASSNDVNKNLVGSLGLGKYPNRVGALPGVATFKNTMEKTHLLTLGSANDLFAGLADMPHFVVDTARTERLASELSKNWRAFGPANLFSGHRMYDMAEITGNADLIDRFLENVSNDHITHIRLTMSNQFLVKTWATYLSSICLIYRSSEGIFDAPSVNSYKGIAEDATVGLTSNHREIQAASLQLETGYGNPYGVSYSVLAGLQPKPSPSDYMPIRGTDLVLLFLKKVPQVSPVIGHGSFTLEQPYMYFQGNINSLLPVTKMVEIAPFSHFALGLTNEHTFPEKSKFLWTKMYTYANDTIYMHVTPDYVIHNEPTPEEVFNVSLGEKAWTGSKTAPFLKYITFKGYAGGSQYADMALGEGSKALTQAVEDYEKDMKREAENSPEKKAITPITTAKVEKQVKSGIESAKGTSESTSIVADTKARKDKKRKGKPEGKPETKETETEIEREEDKEDDKK